MLNLNHGTYKHQLFGCFAFFSVVTVVLCVSLGLQVTRNSHLIELNQAQQASGLRDILITPTKGKLNGTTLKEILGPIQLRQLFPAKISGTNVQLVMAQMDLKPREVLIPVSLANELRLIPGQRISVIIDISEVQNFRNRSNLTKYVGFVMISCEVVTTLTIKDILEDPQGYFPAEDFKKHILTSSSLYGELKGLEDISFEDYSDQAILLFPDRNEFYMGTKQFTIQETDFTIIISQATKRASKVVELLGYKNVHVTCPLVYEYKLIKLGGLYLSIIMRLSNSFLFLLSTLLVYNFLTIQLEEKQAEISTMRLLGMTQLRVISSIVNSSIKVLLPAIIVGVILSIPMQEWINERFLKNPNLSITSLFYNMAWGGFFGTLIPVLASLIPGYNLIQLTLRDLLDHSKSKTKALQINVLRQNDFEYGRLLFAIVCVVFGGTLYFVLPISLFTFDFFMLLSLLFIVLMGFLGGFILLSMNISFLIERFCYMLLTPLISPNILFIALKNLYAHRIRNRRASLMYSISIAFVIFLWTTINIVVDYTYYEKFEKYGTDIDVRSSHFIKQPQLFDQILQRDPDVKDWSWVTQGLSDMMRSSGSKLEITELSNIFHSDIEIYGVMPNLADILDQKFWKMTQQLDQNPLSYLYNTFGHNSIIVPNEIAEKLSRQLNDLVLVSYQKETPIQHIFRVSGIIEKAAGFAITREETLTRGNLVSIPLYMDLAGLRSADEINMQRLVVKMKPYGRTDKVVAQFEKIVRDTDQVSNITLYAQSEQTAVLNSNKILVELVFIALVGIVMLLSCFSLVTTMTANIHDQVKEIAILKCIGLSSDLISSVYQIEAFILIISSCMIGLVVGTLTGYTISNQKAIFKFSEGTLKFPWQITFVIVISAIVISKIATWQALKSYTKLSASELIKIQ